MKIDTSHLKEGVSGDWKVERYTVEPDSLGYRISMLKSGRGVPGGDYIMLKRGSTIVMSDTPDEINDFSHIVYRAKGNVLINGLGLGLLVTALLAKKEVDSITVIEKSQDVINLIAPCFNDSRLVVIHADAFEWKPYKNAKWDIVWHDIWDNICGDNVEEMKKLHRKYGRRTEYQDSWCKSECQRANRKSLSYY